MAEGPSELADFARDLPTTVEDVAALRRLRSRVTTIEAYLRFLEDLGPTSPDRLRQRPGPAGDVPSHLD